VLTNARAGSAQVSTAGAGLRLDQSKAVSDGARRARANGTRARIRKKRRSKELLSCQLDQSKRINAYKQYFHYST